MIAVLFMAIPLGASARIVISEIMYDLEGGDSKREWIEVYNDGADTDISTWRFVENGKNHKLSTVLGTGVLKANTAAIIADNAEIFQSDYPNYSGLLFDSSFSLKNTGEELTLQDDAGVTVDSVTYTPDWGGKGDGNSIHFDGSAWTGATPSPGEATIEVVVSTTTEKVNTPVETVTEETVSVHAHQRSLRNEVYVPELIVTLGRDRLVSVGSPVRFDIDVISPKGVDPHDVRWTFGDGMTDTGPQAQHMYQYSGTYVVFANVRYNNEHAVARTEVNVFTPVIHITQANDTYIELFNETRYEINIGEWIFRTEGGKTIIPQDTIIKSGALVRIPSRALRYPATVNGEVLLENSFGEIVAKWTP